MSNQLIGVQNLLRELDSDTVANLVLAHVEADEKVFDTLDSKAGLILGFALVTNAELLGFLLLASVEMHPLKAGLAVSVYSFFYAGVGFLSAGGISAMMTLFPWGFRRNAPVLREAVTGNLNLLKLIELVSATEKHNSRLLRRKGQGARVASILVLAGLLCLAVVAIWLFHSLTL